jgi:hypothetical protein
MPIRLDPSTFYSYIILVGSVFLILYYRRTLPDQYTKNPHHCQAGLTNRHTPYSTPNYDFVYIIPVIGQICEKLSVLTNRQYTLVGVKCVFAAAGLSANFFQLGLDIDVRMLYLKE